MPAWRVVRGSHKRNIKERLGTFKRFLAVPEELLISGFPSHTQLKLYGCGWWSIMLQVMDPSFPRYFPPVRKVSQQRLLEVSIAGYPAAQLPIWLLHLALQSRICRLQLPSPTCTHSLVFFHPPMTVPNAPGSFCWWQAAALALTPQFSHCLLSPGAALALLITPLSCPFPKSVFLAQLQWLTLWPFKTLLQASSP